MHYIQYYASLLGLLAIQVLPAQQAQLVFRNYNTDQGLPSPEVHDILQDREGYIWISTDNGVCRFNGYTFEKFGPDQGLKSVVVFYQFEDTTGRIWMSTLSGEVFIYQDHQITPYRYNDVLTDFGQIGDFYVDRRGFFHASVPGLGILIVDTVGCYEILKDTSSIHQIIYPIEDRVLTGLISDRRKHSGISIAGPSQPGFCLSIYQHDKWKTIPLFVPHLGPLRRNDVAFRLQHGQILLSHRENLFLLHQDSLLWQIPFETNFNCLYETKNGVLYLGLTGGKGLRVYQDLEALEAGRFQSYLTGWSVSHIIEDQDGGLWVGTLERGVFYAADQQFQVYDQASGLPSAFVSAIAIKNENEIFVGLRDGNIFQMQIQPPKLTSIALLEEEINDLAYDSLRHRLWTSSSRSVQYWDSRQWTPILVKESGNKSYPIGFRKFELLPGFTEILGCNTGNSGFTRINAVTPEIQFRSSADAQLKVRTFAIFKDISGRIWLGLNNGLFEYQDQQLVKTDSSIHTAFSLRVEAIAQLADSTLLVGTKGGGIIFWKGDQVKQVSVAEGLTSSMIENIHVDEAQNIWVGTLNGLNKIAKTEIGHFKVETFTLSDGFPSNEINSIASVKGQIWVATTRGIVKFSAQTAINPLSKAPVIAQIWVNQQLTDPTYINRLKARQNSLSFTVLSLNYKQNGKIPYQYRLHPEDGWTITYNQVINFAALSPDQYLFEVQAENEDGIWSNSTEQRFRIYPPFWKTTWFITIFSCGILSITFLINQNRINRLRQQVKLEKEIYELRQSALRAQMNPHFIFNCLNSIQGFISDGEAQSATRYLAKFSRLIRAVLNTSLAPTISLAEEVDMLHNYLQLEKMRFDDKFSYSIVVETGINPDEFQIPPLLTQSYVENAVIHGLADKLQDGYITIIYALVGNRLRISIQDNGIGVSTSQQKRFGNSALHKSVGMTITSKRLELAASSEKGKLPLIEEVRNEQGSVSGTKVSFFVDLNRTPTNTDADIS